MDNTGVTCSSATKLKNQGPLTQKGNAPQRLNRNHSSRDLLPDSSNSNDT